MKQQIPGISISAYQLNEYQINCKMLLTISDAEAFCETTEFDLPKNRLLEEMILKDVRDQISNVLSSIKNKRGINV